MHADRLLAPLVPDSTSSAWRRDLARIVPETIYRRQPTEKTTNNWNLVAVAGEWMRTKAGLGDSLPWIEASLDRQLELFTPWGMYRDPNDPMAYDHFARLWALDLLDEGYRGRHAAASGDAGRTRRVDVAVHAVAVGRTAVRRPERAPPVERGAAGGDVRIVGLALRDAQRSGCGRRLQAGRASGRCSRSRAGSVRRASSGSSRTAWTRPRAMGTSPTRSTRSTTCWPRPCSPSPGRAPTTAFARRRARPTWAASRSRSSRRSTSVIANAGGTYLEFDTGADLHYNPTGLLRVHRRGVPPGDALRRRQRGRVVPAARRSQRGRWRWARSGATDAGVWHPLAAHGRDDLDPAEFALVSASARRVEFRLTYRGRLRGGATAIAEHVILTPERVEIEHRVDGDVDAVRQCWPMLATDGATPSVITVAGQVRIGRARRRRFQVRGADRRARSCRASGVSEPCRNGFMDACVAQAPGRTIRSKIEASDPGLTASAESPACHAEASRAGGSLAPVPAFVPNPESRIPNPATSESAPSRPSRTPAPVPPSPSSCRRGRW